MDKTSWCLYRTFIPISRVLEFKECTEACVWKDAGRALGAQVGTELEPHTPHLWLLRVRKERKRGVGKDSFAD